jgi:hemerythrin
MIQKSKIIEGVYFVAIPEVNLYIQCGSPAESVKHLIKNGFIKKITKNGVEFETGPNAILLSDIMIQNGDFANISEFSVLQMLYKQGLIIPNHPNNTGLKPLLIGDEAQVEAQMQYIYRGNYGLISKEEIMECGIDELEAQELFNMKLRFAFGKLQSPSNLLDSCFVTSSKTEIRDGVFIKRTAVNIFEISYKNNFVTIDLNLTDKQHYNSPYSLPQYKAVKEYFSIIQSGQGDGWDCVRPSMNSIICFQGKYYLVDAVPNISCILDALSISINDIEGIFLTHCHDDHIGGITTLIRNDKKIKIFGTKIVTTSLIKKLSSLLGLNESEFTNLLEIKELNLESWNSIGELEIKPIISPHPVETTIFVFRTFFQDRYYSYGHFADIIDSTVLKSMIVENSEQPGITQEFYDKTIQEYKQTVDIKKIDIGEGMIHGHYKDFMDDKSGKIILAHNDKELSKEQLKVGTSSLFGLQDVIISTKQNYDYKTVSRYLKSNFPTISLENLELFLNLQIKEFKPKELIYKNNLKIKNLYLILAGLVEKSSHKFDNTVVLEPGVIIGEKDALNGQLVDATFMTKNYVKALEIPVKQFQHFSQKNNLFNYFNNKFDFGNNFLRNKLFCENISYPTINKLISNMNILKCDQSNFEFDDSLVYLIIKGSVNILVNDTILDIAGENDYFGGFQTILNTPSSFNYNPIKECTFYTIDATLVRDIPIAFWKMLEYYTLLQKKLINFSIYNDDHSTFIWNHSYHINIFEMDEQHKKQLEYLDTIQSYTLSDNSDEKIYNTLDKLYGFTKQHFEDEERLMEKYHFEELENHRNIHNELLNKLLVFKQEMEKNSFDKSFIAVILKEWLLQHILEEDIKYSRFLNAKGIY